MLYTFEIILFIISCIFTIRYFVRWYKYISKSWKEVENKLIRIVMGLLPVILLFYFIVIVGAFGASDIVGFYLLFYIVLGYAWVDISLSLTFFFLDISWIDDTLNRNNKAGLIVVVASIISSAFIYGGANVGDGPGFYTVLLAGGLGMLAFYILMVIYAKITKNIEEVTSDHNISSSLRVAGVMLSLAIILGRASSGDYTSAELTVIEFGVGWPALPLIFVCLFIELLFRPKKSDYINEPFTGDNAKIGSSFVSLLYIGIAIVTLFFVPAVV